MWFMCSDRIVALIWDQAGQLGESGEYQMGRSGRGLLLCSELQRCSLRLCQLRTDCLTPVSKFDYVPTHMRFMRPPQT
jgi:hypothetical protein